MTTNCIIQFGITCNYAANRIVGIYGAQNLTAYPTKIGWLVWPMDGVAALRIGVKSFGICFSC